ncbi:MAG: RNA-binding S4 domain-containing protein [Planctomycetota bacterium]
MTEVFRLTREDIRLDALLKEARLASSGGEAKAMIQAGHVLVDGAVETRRSTRLRPGMTVRIGPRELRLAGPPTSLAP